MNTFAYAGGNPISFVDLWGLDTYRANRELGGNKVNSPLNIVSHTFNFTTNADGSINNTYSWGNTANIHGWNLNQPEDIKAAREALAQGKAVRVGDASLDPFVQKAFENKNKAENEHINGVIINNCKWEPTDLVNQAEFLRDGPTPAIPF